MNPVIYLVRTCKLRCKTHAYFKYVYWNEFFVCPLTVLVFYTMTKHWSTNSGGTVLEHTWCLNWAYFWAFGCNVLIYIEATSSLSEKWHENKITVNGWQPPAVGASCVLETCYGGLQILCLMASLHRYERHRTSSYRKLFQLAIYLCTAIMFIQSTPQHLKGYFTQSEPAFYHYKITFVIYIKKVFFPSV